VSEYAIDNKDKTLSATFPIWILILLLPITSLLAFPFQLLAPNWPILLSTALATTFAVWIYETKHALDHLPEDWWRKQCARKGVIGWFCRIIHMPHMIHHILKKRNLNVVGVFGFSVGDWIFGTYRSSKALYRAWLHKDRQCDGLAILKELGREPWSFRIKPTLKRWLRAVFQTAVYS